MFHLVFLLMFALVCFLSFFVMMVLMFVTFRTAVGDVFRTATRFIFFIVVRLTELLLHISAAVVTVMGVGFFSPRIQNIRTFTDNPAFQIMRVIILLSTTAVTNIFICVSIIFPTDIISLLSFCFLLIGV